MNDDANLTMIPEPDPELDALLEDERAIPTETAIDRAGVWSGIEGAIALSTPAAAAAAAAVGKATLFKVGLACFLSGATAGIAVDRSIRAPKAKTLSPSSLTISPKPKPPTLNDVVVEALPTPAPFHGAPSIEPASRKQPAGTPKPSRAQAKPSTKKPELDRERELIDVARAAVAAHRWDEAADALRRHRDTFSSGPLSEERDALSITVENERLGWTEACEAQYQRFAKTYPNSMLLSPLSTIRAKNRK